MTDKPFHIPNVRLGEKFTDEFVAEIKARFRQGLTPIEVARFDRVIDQRRIEQLLDSQNGLGKDDESSNDS